jgi:putative phosphoesterase
MRVAVLADIHANIQALEAVLRDARHQQADTFWLLGDYIDYGAAWKPVLQALEQLNAEHVIGGNHDAGLFDPRIRPSDTGHGQKSFAHSQKCAAEHPEDFQWLRRVSMTGVKIIDDNDQKIMLVHGTPDDPYWGRATPDNLYEINKIWTVMAHRKITTLFCGHSHKRYLLTQEGRSIVNPGSVGQPRNGCPHAQYVLYEDGGVTFRAVPYDIDGAAADIKAADLPEYLWERLYIGR